MSDINSTSQPMSELFKEQNIPQAEIKQSLFSTDLITSEELKKHAALLKEARNDSTWYVFK